RAPFKREIEAFHSALASLAEIVAFVVLGLTINLSVIAQADVWIPGLILGAALAFVIRPALVGLCLIPARLKSNERNFVVFAGLKGPCRSCWAASCSPRTCPVLNVCTASSRSWWCSPSWCKGA